MSFVVELEGLPLSDWLHRATTASVGAALECLAKPSLSLADFAVLLSPGAAELLEPLCQRSTQLTRQRFGRVIRMFAPIYTSNNCVNNCLYCGFARRNDIARLTLSVEEVAQEADAVVAQGFRNLLLVASENPALVPPSYLAQCVGVLAARAPSISLEVAPLSTADYLPIVQAGAEGLVVFQETYQRERYAQLHPSGPKRDFDWRLATPERAYAAGFRKVGLGALMGLSDWRLEALCLAAHAAWLLRHCWKAQLSISLPRIRPAASGFEPTHPVSDRQLVQLVAAYRLLFPDLHLVLSTREPARLRDGLIPLGITQISAGSHTEPGGYSGAGRHRLALNGASGSSAPSDATAQFSIADERSAAQMAQSLRSLQLEPLWKDWEPMGGVCTPLAKDAPPKRN